VEQERTPRKIIETSTNSIPLEYQFQIPNSISKSLVSREVELPHLTGFTMPIYSRLRTQAGIALRLMRRRFKLTQIDIGCILLSILRRNISPCRRDSRPKSTIYVGVSPRS